MVNTNDADSYNDMGKRDTKNDSGEGTHTGIGSLVASGNDTYVVESLAVRESDIHNDVSEGTHSASTSLILSGNDLRSGAPCRMTGLALVGLPLSHSYAPSPSLDSYVYNFQRWF